MCAGSATSSAATSVPRSVAASPSRALLLHALPVTLELATLAVIIATLVAIPLGVLSAVKRDTPLDFGARVRGLIGLSLPNFWLATLALLFTSKGSTGSRRSTTSIPSPIQLATSTDAPACRAIAVRLMAIVMRMTRTTMLEVLNQDYIRTARAKGLRDRVVVYRHALRNALIPVITVIGFQLGALIGRVGDHGGDLRAQWPRQYLLQAIFNRDYPLVQVAALFLATVFVVINWWWTCCTPTSIQGFGKDEFEDPRHPLPHHCRIACRSHRPALVAPPPQVA